jgi:hypothetical protein
MGYLDVSETAVRGPNGTVQAVATTIVSALKDQGEEKDI